MQKKDSKKLVEGIDKNAVAVVENTSPTVTICETFTDTLRQIRHHLETYALLENSAYHYDIKLLNEVIHQPQDKYCSKNALVLGM